MRGFRFVLVSTLALSACLTAAEMERRILDGYRVWSVGLLPNPSSEDLTWSDGRSTEALLRTIRLDIEADRSWFYDRPGPIQGTDPEWAEKRRTAFEPAVNYVWNVSMFNDPRLQALLQTNSGRLEEIFTFRPPKGERYPVYRLYPETQSGFGFTNRFGWRSRQITREKPPNVIRIAMLGDSTTGAYPALVEHWLNLGSARFNLGVRVEIINAARPASGALDAAAIFEYEFDAIDPDYVILYGFGNGIQFADPVITLPPGVVKGHPATTTAARIGIADRLSKQVSDRLEPAARWSAAAGFLRNRLTGQRGGTLSREPAKPATRIAFPPDIDERSPNPEKIASRAGPSLMSLETYLQGLNKIDVIAKQRDTRVFVSTFRVMAFDGMLLVKGDPNNGGIIYRAINEQYWWPYTYAQVHRLAAFYNRTLRTWAESRGHDVIPIDEQMPWRPELYGDGLHELPAGEALHGWIVLQQLMPALRADLVRHRLPRPARPPRQDVEPYWKIERTSVATAIASGMNAPEGAADEIAGAFPSSKIALAYAKAEIVPGDVPLIRTAAEPSAYAASVPIDAATAAGLMGKGWLGVQIRVNEGRIAVGVLNKSGQEFLAQASLDRKPEIQDVYLMIDNLSDVGSLMISNNRSGEAAPSVAELHGAVLKRFRP
jgi:hypothetical protein